jgi:hypothetical protein
MFFRQASRFRGCKSTKYKRGGSYVAIIINRLKHALAKTTSQ